jgi:hypothetical protein
MPQVRSEPFDPLHIIETKIEKGNILKKGKSIGVSTSDKVYYVK